MTCVILQPSYIPWRGYFDLLRRAERFVFLDDVQYDARGWRNRNRILGPNGPQWLTIPVRHRGVQQRGTPIARIEIVPDSGWQRKHWNAIHHAYRRAPHYESVAAWLEPFYRRSDRLLAELTIDLTREIAARLGIEGTRFERASDLDLPVGRKSEHLLAILKSIGARHYLSGPSARDYLDEERLRAAGVEVEYMHYDYPPYPQRTEGFEPRLSIVDLLFMTGEDAARHIWGGVG